MKNSKNYLEKIKKIKGTAIIYARYYFKETNNPYLVNEQVHAGTCYAIENLGKLPKIFSEENVSGKDIKRIGILNILNYVDSNPGEVKVLIVSDITRLFTDSKKVRDFRKFFKRRGIKIVSLVYQMSKYITKRAK